jgi:excisionase family DNA binding protein
MASANEPLTGYTFIVRKETSQILGATERQIERWVAQGKLGYVRMGNRTLHTPEQIRAFVEASTHDAVTS